MRRVGVGALAGCRAYDFFEQKESARLQAQGFRVSFERRARGTSRKTTLEVAPRVKRNLALRRIQMDGILYDLKRLITRHINARKLRLPQNPFARKLRMGNARDHVKVETVCATQVERFG